MSPPVSLLPGLDLGGVLCFSLMLGHPDLVGPRARLSWCILKFGRGNLSNLTCQEFFFPFKARSSLRGIWARQSFLVVIMYHGHTPFACPVRPSQTRIHSGIVAGRSQIRTTYLRKPDLICLVRTIISTFHVSWKKDFFDFNVLSK
jgi:hypothetical protein